MSQAALANRSDPKSADHLSLGEGDESQEVATTSDWFVSLCGPRCRLCERNADTRTSLKYNANSALDFHSNPNARIHFILAY